MADQYDAYRYAQPAAPYNPYQIQGAPTQGYAPSSSLWGNIREPMVAGAVVGGNLGSVIPGVGTAIGATIGGGYGLVRGLGQSKAAKEAQEAAKGRQREAVRQWRVSEYNRMLPKLGQAGADVQADLGGELQQTLAAGGEYGDQNALNDAMTKFQQRYQQYMIGRQRAGQSRQVDAMFSDPRRKNDQAQRLGAARTQGMNQIAESYRIGNRGNAFNQARRGTQGSSMDVEQRGELARGRDQSAQGLQAGLDERGRQYRLQDQQQASTLKGLIYSDDPNTAAALSRTLEGINNQGAQVRENEAIRSQRSALDSATSQNYSQAVGGLLTAGSRPMEYYLDHRGSGA